MKLFEELVLKYKYPDWSRNPEFGLIDVILEKNSDIILLMRDDIVGKSPSNQFGRGIKPCPIPTINSINYRDTTWTVDINYIVPARKLSIN